MIYWEVLTNRLEVKTIQMKNLITQIRKSQGLAKVEFAAVIGVNRSTITRWEKGERTPEHSEIGALLRIAEPDQQRQLLELLGIEDVEQFAADLLAAAGVQQIESGGNGNREQPE